MKQQQELKVIVHGELDVSEMPNPAREVNEKGSAAELKMAQTIIESMTGKFEPKKYHDEYREKVQQAIEKKIAGKEITAPKEKEITVSNLMEALTKSLEMTKKPKTPVKRTPKSKKKEA